MVEVTNGNLVASLKQCFTSKGQIQYQGNIRYNWKYIVITFQLCFHVFEFVCNYE